jgi:CspA family cold shock protein
MATRMYEGKVKFYNEAKGYGFITDDSGVDYFVHATKVTQKPIKKDDLVEFELQDGQKGKQCVNVIRKK